MTTLIPTTRPMSKDTLRQTSNTTFIGGNVAYLNVIASPALEDNDQISMREQYLPENDAPEDERAAWREVYHAVSVRRYAQGE